MRFLKRKSICSLYAVIAFIFAGSAFGAVPVLPEGLVMKDEFQAGLGAPVGKVRIVQGKVIIIHANIMNGYWAKIDLPLYKGDTIVTQNKSRINLMMNDKSIITLSSNTKLVINKSIYNKKEKHRSSFLGLTLGKARFLVTKLLSFKRSEFRVKTVTAVCGVRGSEFIIVATDKLTEVTALEDTELSVMSLATPDEPPLIVTDFERTGVALGEPPYEPELVPLEEIEVLKKVFTGTPEVSAPEKDKEVQKEETEESDTEDKDTEEDKPAEGESEQTGTAEDASAEGDAGQTETAEDEPAEDDAEQTGTAESESAEGGAVMEETQAEAPAGDDIVVGETEEGQLTESGDAVEGTTESRPPEGDAIGEDVEEENFVSEVTAEDEATVDTAVSGTTGISNVIKRTSISGTAEIDENTEVESEESEITVDSTAIYVPADVLVEPEATTALDPVIETEAITPDWNQESEMEEQVAEEKLQEDLAIPPFPPVPE